MPLPNKKFTFEGIRKLEKTVLENEKKLLAIIVGSSVGNRH
jgi:hypothetical protein